MFIAIIGTRSAGKSTVQDYLIDRKGFQAVRLHKQDVANITEQSDSDSTYSGESEMLLMDEPTPNPLDHRLSFLSMISPPQSALPSPLSGGGSQGEQSLYFSTSSDMLEHATRNWRMNFVTIDLDTQESLEQFVRRPFIMVVNVDAPILLRFERALSLGDPGSLEGFVRAHDGFYYGETSVCSSARSTSNTSIPSLLATSRLAKLHIVNAFDTIPALHSHLDDLNLLDQGRLRPGWDAYFMQLAELASERSNCMKRRVGAILVRNKRILATGYNGTPRGLTNCNEGGCTRCNSGKEASDECVCLHAEENALLEAGRERVGDGAVLYCNTCPCLKCTIKIIQTGVKEVVYNLSYKVDDSSAALFSEAGVVLRRHSMPK